jgi:hypothetical protein
MAEQFVKDPDAVETFTVVWCSEDGTNDGTSVDTGELQGETISLAAAQMPSGITLDSENTNVTSIQGVSYGLNTVHNMVLSGGTAINFYSIVSRITTSGGRTLDKTIIIECRET